MAKVAIVGGGIAGLAAAIRLSDQSSIELSVFEASERLGGALRTDLCDGYLIEHSADMFVSDPDSAIQFVRKLGWVSS